MLSDLPGPREITGVTPANFAEKVTNTYEPAVMRNLASDWPIVKAGRTSLEAVGDYLKRFDAGHSGHLLTSPFSANGRLTYNDRLDDLNFSRSESPFSAAINRMLARRDETHDPQHCFQALRVPQILPGMEREVRTPLIAAGVQASIWIGTKVVVPAHFDDASNLAFCAAGKRRVTLFPPEQVANLYVGRLDFTPAGQPVSLVDARDPDLRRFPKFAQALDAAVSVELEPGDAIYIPTPWWHHIESLDRFNVLVNYFWTHTASATAIPFTLLLHAIRALRPLPQGEREAWRALLDYYVFETSGDPIAHLEGSDPGIMAPMNPAISRHMHQYLLAQLSRGDG